MGKEAGLNSGIQTARYWIGNTRAGAEGGARGACGSVKEKSVFLYITKNFYDKQGSRNVFFGLSDF